MFLKKGMSYQEIADKAGLNYNNVKWAIYKARQESKEKGIKDLGKGQFKAVLGDNKKKQKTGFEERKPRVFKDDDIFTIISAGKNERTVKISENALRQLKQYYCLEKLTINEVCREMRLPRRDFYLIKTAWGITKDDVPFLDEDLINKSASGLAIDSLQEKKRLYFVTLQEKEIEHLRKENNAYRKKDYFLTKAHDLVVNELPELAKRYNGPVIKPKKVHKGYIVEPNIFDLHLGKLSWKPETGEDYDYKIARKRFRIVTSDNYNRAKEIPVERFVYPFGSDFWHIDNNKGTTNAGTLMDYDSRKPKLFMVGVEMLIESIDAYSEIAPVDVVLVAGNHDEEISFYALQVLAAWYKDSDRVRVWNNIRQRKYVEFGVNMIGFDHGAHAFKKLPALMSSEVPKAWGRVKVREWHTGHLHSLYVKEEPGVTVRRLSSITATDKWHDKEGFTGALCRSQCFQWCREIGLRSIWETPIWPEYETEESVLTL